MGGGGWGANRPNSDGRDNSCEVVFFFQEASRQTRVLSKVHFGHGRVGGTLT